jgi:phosphinothricin acetyltransferase
LLDALIGHCVQLGYRQMLALIGDSANAASIRLHERAGFRHTGVMPTVGWKHRRWLDVVIMQRELGEGSSTSPNHVTKEVS